MCRGSLKAAARDYEKELNYQEAFKESYVAYASPGLPSEVESLLASAEVRVSVLSTESSHNGRDTCIHLEC